ncbi:transposase [Enterococcus faecalis]
MKGKKRHIITDTLGNLLHIKVHTANWHDTTVCGIVFEECLNLNQYPSLLCLSADSGYRGTTVTQVTEILNKTIDVVAKGATSWIVLSMRWVVERTFAWN